MAESGPRCGAWGRCFSLPLTRGVSTFHAVVSVSYLTRRGDLSEPSCAPAIPLSRPEVSSRRRWIHFAFNHQPFVQSISGQEGCRVLQLVCLVASVHVHKAPHGSCSLCGGLNQVDSWREPGVEGVIWLGRSSPALCGRPASAVTPSRFIDILAGVEASLSLLCAGGVCVGVLSELWWVFFLCMLTELSYIYFFFNRLTVVGASCGLLWCTVAVVLPGRVRYSGVPGGETGVSLLSFPVCEIVTAGGVSIVWLSVSRSARRPVPWFPW